MLSRINLNIFAYMFTNATAYKELTTKLKAIYDDGEAATIADMLLTHITCLSYTQRLVDKDKELSQDIRKRYKSLSEQLISGMPIQYITNTAYFMGKEYYVDENVLIPRPETEELVNWIIDDHQNEEVSILDIGSGSGCIPISLKLALQKSKVTSIDISNKALEVSRKNAASLNTDVQFNQVDFLDKAKHSPLSIYDIIVSNPPYIPIHEKKSLDKNVRDYEPGTALFVPDKNPLIFYKVIAEFGLNNLNTYGTIYCELHKDLAEETGIMFIEQGYQTELRKDLFGNNRMLKAKNKGL